MEQKFVFKCAGDGLEEIPAEVIEKGEFSFPEVHLNVEEMIRFSKAIKEYRNEEYIQIPFCMTVEAEALGAKINLGDRRNGPRVLQYAFNSMDELDNIHDIDYTKHRIEVVLKAVKLLSSEGENVILSVQGPYSIAQSLVDPTLLFKATKKEKCKVEKFLSFIENEVVKFIREGIKHGARIISYGDASGTLDILGPKMYSELSGKYNCNVLKRISQGFDDVVIHVCGATSASLHNSGLIKSRSIELEGELTYGEALKKVIEDDGNIKVVGHNCIKRLNKKVIRPKVWVIEFN